MIVARDCDPLRRFAWSRFKNWRLFTISAVRARPSAEIRVVEVQFKTFYDFSMRARPSAEIRVVEVQKLRTFCDFCGARATLCGDSRGRGSKTETFYDFLHARATLCGDSRGRVQKLELFTIFSMCARDPLRSNAGDFLRFLRRARDPLRRFAWSRLTDWGGTFYDF